MWPHVGTLMDLIDPSHAVITKLFWHFIAKHYSEPLAPNILNYSFCRIMIMTLRFDFLEISSLFLYFFHKCWVSDYFGMVIHPSLDVQDLQIIGRRCDVLLQSSSLYPLDKLQKSRRCLQKPGHTYFLLLTWYDNVKYWYTSLLEDEVGNTTDQLCSVCPMARRLI